MATEYEIDLLAQLPLIEKEEEELHDLDQMKEYFEAIADNIIGLLKKLRSKKVDSIPQTNVTK